MVGAEMEEIRSMASATGVEVTARVAEHLHLPGRVPAKTSPQRMLDEANIEMAAWYGLADVYVCTSFIESFSLTALDAMALGLPVIVPDTVGISDLVRNGENGFIVPARNPSAVADRLRWLAAHRDECRRMGENARETVRSCSWDEIARRHLEVYEMVVAKQV
jgi:glycosyltransferase involved in cell wall biosynthesis